MATQETKKWVNCCMAWLLLPLLNPQLHTLQCVLIPRQSWPCIIDTIHITQGSWAQKDVLLACMSKVKGDYHTESPSTTTDSIHSVVNSIKKCHWCFKRGRDRHSAQELYKEVRKDDRINCALVMHLKLGAKPNHFTMQYHQNWYPLLCL